MTNQVEEVKAKADVVSIIGERIELKKAGRNFKANCPFHGEKTPSFMVSPELQFFKCFGCQESGDVIAFLEKYEGMEFIEALKYLANRYGIELKNEWRGKGGIKEKIFEINLLSLKFYEYILHSHVSGRDALNYLKNQRGLKIETVKKFGLGFSPDADFAIGSYLIKKKKYSVSDLADAGLVYESGGRPKDRFRGRVVFPLFDHRGNVCGFAGRLLPGGKEQNLAKYINSPDTPAYHKSLMLYGLNVTKNDIKKEKTAIVVEGELDLISSWQVGVKNVVALKGSAFTQEQARLLSRFADRAILAMDTDFAGDLAARRGISIAEEESLEVEVARIEKYKDPDEAAIKDPDYLKEKIKKPIGVWDFIIESIFSRHKRRDGSEKFKISKELIPVVAEIRNAIVLSHYINKISQKLDVPYETVQEEIEKFKLRENSVFGEEVLKKDDDAKDRKVLLEERLLALILQGIDLPEKEFSKVKFTTPLASRLLKELIDFKKREKKFTVSKFEKHLPPELVVGMRNIYLSENTSDLDPETRLKEYKTIILELKILEVKQKLDKIAKEIFLFEKKGEKKNLTKAKESFSEISKELSFLVKEQSV
jgi:DNA primase